MVEEINYRLGGSSELAMEGGGLPREKAIVQIYEQLSLSCKVAENPPSISNIFCQRNFQTCQYFDENTIPEQRRIMQIHGALITPFGAFLFKNI